VFPDAARRVVPAGVGRLEREVGRRRVRTAERVANGPVATGPCVVPVELRAAIAGRGRGTPSAQRRPGRLLRRPVRSAGDQQTHDGPVAVRQSRASRQEPHGQEVENVKKLENRRRQF